MKKRVLLISNLYSPNIGGIENSFHHLSLEYEKLGYLVDIVASDRNNISDKKLERFEEISSHVIVKRHTAIGGSIKNIINSYKELISLLKNQTLQGNYTIVVARSPLGVIACKQAGINNVCYLLPGVAKFQTQKSNLYSNASFRTSLRLRLSTIYNHAIQYIAVRLAMENFVFSKSMQEQVHRALNIKVSVDILKPGVDPNRFYYVNQHSKKLIRRKLDLPEDKRIILGLGRFVKAKGFDTVIESLIRLPEDYIVLLVGHGVEVLRYSELAIKHDVADRFIVRDATSFPEEFYQLSDFFAMMSTYEPLGQTILEAQACGLPIVALNPNIESVDTAIDEVTSVDTCELCSINNADAFSQAILRVSDRLANEDINNKSISKFAHENFNWKSLALNLGNTSSKGEV